MRTPFRTKAPRLSNSAPVRVLEDGLYGARDRAPKVDRCQRPDHLLAHTSPMGWSHISLTGDYLWEQAAIAVDGFRPLNTARSRLKLVA